MINLFRLPKTVILFLFVLLRITVANSQSLTAEERSVVIDMLEENSRKFLAGIERISEAQWQYKPAADRWSVAETAEHITLSEGLLLSIAQQSLKSADEGKRASALEGKENSVIERLKDRSQKADAPDVIRPTGKFATRKELIEAFKLAREKTMIYVKTTNDPLKNHIVSHPLFGELTAYQWLVMIPAHANRHVDQLEEVKKLKDFPVD
ncbi:MAG: hypothetical protein C0490_16355 [Marivirga sp.]|nr:hypothetical protein [Marivirga sp.]